MTLFWQGSRGCWTEPCKVPPFILISPSCACSSLFSCLTLGWTSTPSKNCLQVSSKIAPIPCLATVLINCSRCLSLDVFYRRALEVHGKIHDIVQLPINISQEEFLYLETGAFGRSRQVCVGEHQGVEGRRGHPARPHPPHSGKGRNSQIAQSKLNLMLTFLGKYVKFHLGCHGSSRVGLLKWLKHNAAIFSVAAEKPLLQTET